MSIQKNLANALRRYKEARQLSFRDFADELGLPLSSIENYLNGTGNPRADTLELISQKANIPLIEIVSGPLPGQEQAETIVRAAKTLSDLSPERRERAVALFRALADVFAEED